MEVFTFTLAEVNSALGINSIIQAGSGLSTINDEILTMVSSPSTVSTVPDLRAQFLGEVEFNNTVDTLTMDYSQSGILDLSLKQPGASDHSYSVFQATDTVKATNYPDPKDSEAIAAYEDEAMDLPQDEHEPCSIGELGPEVGNFILCPSIRTILKGDPYNSLGPICPVENCDQHVPQFKSLCAHLRSHCTEARKKGSQAKKFHMKLEYHCPVRGCSYSRSIGGPERRFFACMKYLVQHFRKIHGARPYLCTICNRYRYPTKSMLAHHKRMCGVKFSCNDCSNVYTALSALQTHCHRNGHLYNKQKYQEILKLAKSTIQTPDVKQKPKPVTEETMVKPEVASVSSLHRPTSLKRLLPRPGSEPTSMARVVMKIPMSANLAIDYGTQTDKQIRRGRASASQHCQTEYFNGTRTTGTGTHMPRTSSFQGSTNIKRSAETQTKKFRISTQTQTPVVTKRKRSTRKLQSVSMETQTPVNSPVSKIPLMSWPDKPQPTPDPTPVLVPVATPTSPTTPLLPSSPFTSTPSQQFSLLNFCEPSDEVHSQTQTDPNPFFGLYKESVVNDLDILFAETDEHVNSMLSLTTSETQTMQGINAQLPTNMNIIDSNELACGEELLFTDADVSDGEMESYLETMDSETQTAMGAVTLQDIFSSL